MPSRPGSLLRGLARVRGAATRRRSPICGPRSRRSRKCRPVREAGQAWISSCPFRQEVGVSELQGLPPGAEVVAGPERVGSEQRWRVRLADGRAALLARLAPELARDLALRRRYVRDLERLRALTD